MHSLLLPMQFGPTFMRMPPSGYRYFALYKPQNMLSQFTGKEGGPFLGDLGFDFPQGSHAIGRLDKYSEGLLLITTNPAITRLLFQGQVPHRRTYVVQVRNPMSLETLQHLRKGVFISSGNDALWLTSPCEAEIIPRPETLAPGEQELPEFVPQTWLRITLCEGRFHQVRKMVHALRHKCFRLIRTSIEDLSLGAMRPGEIRELPDNDFFRLLRL